VLDEQVVAGVSLMALLVSGVHYLLTLDGHRPTWISPYQTDRQSVMLSLLYLLCAFSVFAGSIIAHGITLATGQAPRGALAVCGGVLVGVVALGLAGWRAHKVLPRHTATAAAARARRRAASPSESPESSPPS